MGGKPGKRLRWIGRWGVWVCTGGLLGLLIVLIWIDVDVRSSHERSGRLVPAMVVNWTLEGTRLVVEVVPDAVRYGGDEGGPSWTVDVFTYSASVDDGVGWHRDSWWWKRPFRFAYGNGTVIHGHGVDLPLAYPAVVMVVWSGWLVWKRRELRVRRRRGCCVGCGYLLDGLEGGVCPECGAERRVG